MVIYSFLNVSAVLGLTLYYFLRTKYNKNSVSSIHSKREMNNILEITINIKYLFEQNWDRRL